MSKTVRKNVVGRRPPCYIPSRLCNLDDVLALNLQRKIRRFVAYNDLSNVYKTPTQKNEFLNTSFNFVDFVKSRELNINEPRSVCKSFANRFILSHDMLKESMLSLGAVDQIASAQWLNNRQIILGTKCNKLLIYNVNKRHTDEIPTIRGTRSVQREHKHGIITISINPNRSLLATRAHLSFNVAVYRLPDIEPVFIGEQNEDACIADLSWIDDRLLVTGSKYGKLKLWQIDEEKLDALEYSVNGDNTRTTPEKIAKISQKKCFHVSHLLHTDDDIRFICFNPKHKEFAVTSSEEVVHFFDAQTFSPKTSRRMPYNEECFCIAAQPLDEESLSNGMYAMGCRSHTFLVDPRTLQLSNKMNLSSFSTGAISTISFQGNILTMSTLSGELFFYDLRAGKFLEDTESSRPIIYQTNKRFSLFDAGIINHSPAVHTHCYDLSGTRLFVGGGSPWSVMAYYAAVWQ